MAVRRVAGVEEAEGEGIPAGSERLVGAERLPGGQGVFPGGNGEVGSGQEQDHRRREGHGLLAHYDR